MQPLVVIRLESETRKGEEGESSTRLPRPLPEASSSGGKKEEKKKREPKGEGKKSRPSMTSRSPSHFYITRKKRGKEENASTTLFHILITMFPAEMVGKKGERSKREHTQPE